MPAFLHTKRPKQEKISDPLAHAQRSGLHASEVQTRGSWERYACHFTTTAHFGEVNGIYWYNNCGPTALTNLLCMYIARKEGVPCGLDTAKKLYGRVAQYGTRHLFFINSENRLFHGTSDIRARTYIKRICRQVLGVTPKIALRRITVPNVRKSIEDGALLYLMLWEHPEYGSHHMLGYGMTSLRDNSTAGARYYIKAADAHSPKPRYLDLEDFENVLAFYYEVQFPE